jgi:hypothetical protein
MRISDSIIRCENPGLGVSNYKVRYSKYSVGIDDE